jgi:hypothetical protein
MSCSDIRKLDKVKTVSHETEIAATFPTRGAFRRIAKEIPTPQALGIVGVR